MDRYSYSSNQKLFALIILMGIIYKSSIMNHWSTDSLYYTLTFQKLLHIIDFSKVRTFTSAANSSYDPNESKRVSCHQVYPFTDIKLCLKLYYPKKQFSVGRSLALFKYQLHLKRYIKSKRLCFGIKLNKPTSRNSIRLIFLVKIRKKMFYNGNENSDMSAPKINPL